MVCFAFIPLFFFLASPIHLISKHDKTLKHNNQGSYFNKMRIVIICCYYRFRVLVANIKMYNIIMYHMKLFNLKHILKHNLKHYFHATNKQRKYVVKRPFYVEQANEDVPIIQCMCSSHTMIHHNCTCPFLTLLLPQDHSSSAGKICSHDDCTRNLVDQ